MVTQFIVAEVSKNWDRGMSPEPAMLCEKFEEVIEFNRCRGYRLYSFQLHRLVTGPGAMNETIIAVFERGQT